MVPRHFAAKVKAWFVKVKGKEDDDDWASWEILYSSFSLWSQQEKLSNCRGFCCTIKVVSGPQACRPMVSVLALSYSNG